MERNRKIKNNKELYIKALEGRREVYSLIGEFENFMRCFKKVLIYKKVMAELQRF